MRKGMALALTLLAAGLAALAGPRLVVDPEVYDFGTVAEGLLVETTFTLRNVGDAPLIFTKPFSGSIGLKIGNPSSVVIPSGGRAYLEIAFDTSGWKGMEIEKRSWTYVQAGEIKNAAAWIPVLNGFHGVGVSKALEVEGVVEFLKLLFGPEQLKEVLHNPKFLALIFSWKASETEWYMFVDPFSDPSIKKALFYIRKDGGKLEFSTLVKGPTLKGRVRERAPYEVSTGHLLYDWGLLLIDVRSREEFVLNHLLGAINIPAEELDAWLTRLPRLYWIVLYDNDGWKAEDVVGKLEEVGSTSGRMVVFLAGGLCEWLHTIGDNFIVWAPGTKHEISCRFPWLWGGISCEHLLDIYCLVVDLRSHDEFEDGHLPGALNIEPEEIPEWVATLPPTGDTGVRIICLDYDGGSASDTAAWLRAHGYPQSSYVVGGFRDLLRHKKWGLYDITLWTGSD